MAQRPDPAVALHQAPASPADELAQACAETDVKAFADSGFDVDCVQVYAFRRGEFVAGGTAIAGKRWQN